MWFLLAVLFLILWLRASSLAKRAKNDTYGQGYWDGYRAFGDKVRKLLDAPNVDTAKLRTFIDEGEGSSTGAPEPTPNKASAPAPYTQTPVVMAEATIENPAVVQQPAPEPLAEVVETPPTPVLSAEEQTREKERITLRNLNIMLYMGSFLLVAAAAAFIAAAMPETVRLVGLIAVVVVFYVAGIALYRRVPRLKPAAIAFTGTALAILPFVGIALTLLGSVDARVAWLVVSATGLLAYGLAGVLLQSQVVAYLTMASVLSFATASVATAQLAVVWYFIVLIGVALVITTIGHFWRGVLPRFLVQPIETTGNVVTPVALVASLFAVPHMQLFMYEVLFGIGAAHYLVVWLQRRQYVYENIVRGLLHITLLLVGWDILQPTDLAGAELYGLWWCGVALLQVGYSLWRAPLQGRRYFHSEAAWLVVQQILLVVGAVFWAGSPHAAVFTTVDLVLLGAVSLASALRLRNPGWGYVGLVALWALPMVIGRWASIPAWDWSTLVVLYVALAASSLAGYWQAARRQHAYGLARLFLVAIATYSLTALWCGAIADSAIVLGWALMLTGATAVGLSYASPWRGIEVIGAVLVAGAAMTWVGASAIDYQWRGILALVAGISTVAIGAAAYHLSGYDAWRRNALIITTMALAGLLVFFADNSSLVAQRSALLLLAVGAVASLGLRVISKQRQASPLLTYTFTAGYFGYLSLAWIVSLTLHEIGYSIAVYLLATAVLWAGSHIERVATLVLIGNITLVVAVVLFWQWQAFGPTWVTFGIGWLSAVPLYATYWLYVRTGDTTRQWLQLGSTWVLLVLATALAGLHSPYLVIAAIVSACVSALLLVAHAYVLQGRTQQLQTYAVGIAAGIYTLVGVVFSLRHPEVAAWLFALAALCGVWLSYRTQQVAIELLAASVGVVAIASWLRLAPLGEWYVLTTVVVSTGVLIGAAILHHLLDTGKDRRDGMIGVAMVVFAGLSLALASSNMAVQLASMLLLVSGVVVAHGTRWLQASRGFNSTLSSLCTGAYVVYLVLAWLLSWQLTEGWHALVYALAIFVIWTASHIEKVRWLVVVALPLLAVLATTLWPLLRLDLAWMTAGVTWFVAIISYTVYWLYAARGDAWRQTACLAAVLVALTTLAVIGIAYSDIPRAVFATASLVVAAIVAGIHGYLIRRPVIIELSVYVATLGLQRIGGLFIPEVSLAVYAHWWAITLGLVALWRKQAAGRRLGIGMGLITAAVGYLALSQGGLYQLLFLAEHIALLIVGALARKQWAVWWGIIASVGAILYFIKDYTFLWLGTLGLFLIALVVWRLVKINNSIKE